MSDTYRHMRDKNIFFFILFSSSYTLSGLVLTIYDTGMYMKDLAFVG